MKAIVDLFQEYAAQSIAAQGLEEKRLSIAGFPVHLKFAGGRWSDLLTRALNHLQIPSVAEPSKHHLTVSILDGSITPQNPLLRFYLKALTDFWPQYTGPRGELLHLHGGSVAAFYQPGADILSIVDHEANLGFYWKRDLSPLPYYIAGSPMRALIHAWMTKRGYQFVHGGAIGTEMGGVLLVGKGGSGKSTSVLACLDSGLKYAGDDYCLVNPANSHNWELHSVYNTAKLVGESDLAKFDGLAAHVWNPRREANEKVTMFLHDVFPGKLIRRFPLRAILVPAFNGESDSSIEPIAEGAALMALGPSSLAQLPASGPGDLGRIARLVRNTPCFRLRLGTNLAQIPGAICRLLGTLNESNR